MCGNFGRRPKFPHSRIPRLSSYDFGYQSNICVNNIIYPLALEGAGLRVIAQKNHIRNGIFVKPQTVDAFYKIVVTVNYFVGLAPILFLRFFPHIPPANGPVRLSFTSPLDRELLHP